MLHKAINLLKQYLCIFVHIYKFSQLSAIKQLYCMTDALTTYYNRICLTCEANILMV